jgi:hypothetical protein
MTVIRAGYFDGRYAQPGDVIEVAAMLVDSLTQSGFAVVREDDPPLQRRRK